jgi:hypothetical protein
MVCTQHFKQSAHHRRNRAEHRCSGKVGSSCSTSGTRRVTLVFVVLYKSWTFRWLLLWFKIVIKALLFTYLPLYAPLVEQELPTFPEHLCSALFLLWCALCLKCCVQTIVCPFCFVHLLSILLRLMDSDYPFLIFKLFLLYIKWYNIFRMLVTRQRYHRKRKRKQIKIVRIHIFVVYLWNVWKQK